MFDLGWSELLVIGIVALIVVGPKDLPVMFRRMGQFTGKARAMAREFSSAMDKAADEAGVKDMQRDLRKMSNPKQMGLDAFDEATGDLKGWSPDRDASTKSASKPGSASADVTEKSTDPAARKALERHEREAAAASARAATSTASDDPPT